ncbi:cupin-like domain-containing protein [Vibrio sp. 10N.237.312.B06]|uniref:cupin-like domain-containing protein n=1 Tax=Vibrio sp. 10N.237.312.B06 TaxID=3229974 RepID=UPI00354B31E5
MDLKINDFDYIEYPGDEEFFNKYIKQLKPVVIKNFFAGQPIADLSTKEKTLSHLCNLPIEVQEEYMSRYINDINTKNDHVESEHTKKRSITLKEYFDYIENNPESKVMCMEFQSPEKLASLYNIPTVCNPKDNESEAIVNQCFVGNKGNTARIHFDKAGTNGFLYQVFGRKRFIIWPHKSSKKLLPFTQFGAWAIDRMTDKERRDFLSFTGGQEVVLQQGDCMYVPTLCWHYADYIDDSMSISLRFRRANYVTKLANVLFPDFYYQGIVHKIRNQDNAEKLYQSLIDEIESLSNIDSENGVDAVKKIREETKRIYSKLYPEEKLESHTIFELEELLPPLLPSYYEKNHAARKIHQ